MGTMKHSASEAIDSPQNSPGPVTLSPLLTTKQVVEYLQISEAGLYRMISQKRFPAGLRIGGKKGNRWKQETIESWLQAQTR